MFSSTVDQVVKALGAGYLHGVKNVSTANEVVPFGIVVKERKRKFLVLKKSVYTTTEFTLRNVLRSDSLDLEKLLSTRTIVDFLRTSKFTLKGKLGAELKKELIELNLDGDDSVTCQADLGDLEQVDVEVNELMKVLEGRKVNLKHLLVAGLLQEPKTMTMCLITSVVRVKNSTTLTCVSNKDFRERAEVLKEEEDVELDESKTRKMVLPAGTALAYGVHELKVDMNSGDVQLLPLNAEPGGFVVKHESLSTFYMDAGEGTGPEEPLDLSMKSQPTEGKTDAEAKACEANIQKELVAEALVHQSLASNPESTDAEDAGSETEPSPSAAGDASPDAEKAGSSETAPSAENKTQTALEETEPVTDSQTPDAEMPGSSETAPSAENKTQTALEETEPVTDSQTQTEPATTEAEADAQVMEDKAGDETKHADTNDMQPMAEHAHGSDESADEMEYHSACSNSCDTSRSESSLAPDWEMVTVAEVHASRDEEPSTTARTQPDGEEEDDTQTQTARVEEEPSAEEKQPSAEEERSDEEEDPSDEEEAESSAAEEEPNAEEEEASAEEEEPNDEEEEPNAEEGEANAEEEEPSDEEEEPYNEEEEPYDEEEEPYDEEEEPYDEEEEPYAEEEEPSDEEEEQSDEEAQPSTVAGEPSAEREAQTADAGEEPSTETKATTSAEVKEPTSNTETQSAPEEKAAHAESQRDFKTGTPAVEAGASAGAAAETSHPPRKPSSGVELAAQLLTGQRKME